MGVRLQQAALDERLVQAAWCAPGAGVDAERCRWGSVSEEEGSREIFRRGRK